MSKKNQGGVGELFRTVLYAGLIALGVRTMAYEPFNIPSSSMVPTLLVGDYLFVSKFSYGYSKHSMPFSLPILPNRVLTELPERGDVAVFKLPTNTKIDYIKRIIGLPGDSLQVKKGILHINGKAVKRERIEDFVTRDKWGNVRRMPQFIETLPNGVSHPIIEESDNGPLDNTPVYVIPAGHVFGMGDNRNNSQDSRVLSAVGYIPIENLVGRADFMFFSTDGTAKMWQIWKWPSATRFSRIFTGIN